MIYLIQLFHPQASVEIKEEQFNFILKPIVKNLREEFGSPRELNVHLENIVSEMRSHVSKLLGYAELNTSYLKKVAIITNPKIKLISNNQYKQPIADTILVNSNVNLL